MQDMRNFGAHWTHTQRRACKEAQRKSRKCPSLPAPVLTLPPKWALLRRQSPPPSAFSRLPLLPTLEPGTGSSHPGNVRRQGPPRRCKLGHPIRRKSVSNFTMAGPAANKYHLFWTSVPPALFPYFSPADALSVPLRLAPSFDFPVDANCDYASKVKAHHPPWSNRFRSNCRS